MDQVAGSRDRAPLRRDKPSLALPAAPRPAAIWLRNRHRRCRSIAALVLGQAIFLSYNPGVVTNSGPFFTLEEAQKAMGLTPARMEKLIEEGKIQVVRDGWKVLVPRQAILDYLAEVSAVPLKQREGRSRSP
jgi:excisionase family DNA binding protein